MRIPGNCLVRGMKAMNKTKILILGGGFGGLYTALNLEKGLAKDADIEVTLVNRENFFLFTPMLHEVAASDLDITHIVSPVRKLLKRVRIFHGDVESIDLEKRVVSESEEINRRDSSLRATKFFQSISAVTSPALVPFS